MSRKAVDILLTVREQELLQRWCRGQQTPRALGERARIILAAAEGWGNDEIAQRQHTRPARVSKWRRRFARQRCAGLQDAPRPGQPVKYGPGEERRLLAQLDQLPPPGYAA